MKRSALTFFAIVAPMLSSTTARADTDAVREMTFGSGAAAQRGYFRESSLPLCQWDDPLYSLQPFMVARGNRGRTTMARANTRQPMVPRLSPWTCHTARGGVDSCTWSGSQPIDSRYWMLPRSGSASDLKWPDGSGAYDVWVLACTSPNMVSGMTVDGKRPDGAECGSTMQALDVVLAEVDGGRVDHVRPGRVVGGVTIGLGQLRRLPGDLVLALQVLDAEGWHDVATLDATTERSIGTFRVEARVPEFSDVRLQVRGKERCDQRIGAGYDLRAAEIFVEVCVPDDVNPGACL